MTADCAPDDSYAIETDVMEDLLKSSPDFVGADFDGLLERLAADAGSLETSADWPRQQFAALAEAGVLGWVVPRHFGGSEQTGEALVYGYDRLAAACMTTTFVLTQRNGACLRIAGAENDELKSELLPPLVAGEMFATVGISHLTTSRQHWKRPTVQATLDDECIVMDGSVPWVTGAPEADYVVTGGTCEDGRQVLVALPTDLDGVAVDQPAELLSLSASQTASIALDNVRVPRRFLLAGPVEGVMTRGQGGGTGSVATSSLAVGLCERAIRFIESESEARPDLTEIATPLRRELNELRGDLYASARGEESPPDGRFTAESIRRRANSLALRSTQAQLGASKGAGFVHGHPAERAVREAMFFLVWSCPQPVLAAALREFACLNEGLG